MISKIKISLAWKWVIASLVIECFMLSLMVVKNVNQLEDNLSQQSTCVQDRHYENKDDRGLDVSVKSSSRNRMFWIPDIPFAITGAFP